MPRSSKMVRGVLPGLDCGSCSYGTCDAMAAGIERGEAKAGDCVVVKAGKAVVLKVGGKEVPMGSFVQELIKGTVLGMLSTLKGAEVKEGDLVELKIRVGK